MAIQNEANVEIPLAASTVALYKAKKQTKKQGASCETESIQTTIRERSKKKKKKNTRHVVTLTQPNALTYARGRIPPTPPQISEEKRQRTNVTLDVVRHV